MITTWMSAPMSLPGRLRRSAAAMRHVATQSTSSTGASSCAGFSAAPSSRSASGLELKEKNRKDLWVALALALALIAGASPAPADTGSATGKVLELYGTIYEALVTNQTGGVVESAAGIAAVAEECGKVTATSKQCAPLANAAKKVSGADLEALRGQFKELSVAVDHYLRAASAEGWDLYYCPMAGAFWIQTAEGVRNPYYGPSMLKCGDKVAGPAELD